MKVEDRSRGCRGRFRGSRLHVLIVLSIVICHVSSASPPSSLEGRATDWLSGSPIEGLTITIHGEDRPITRETRSDAWGAFRFPVLPPGRYSVTASRAGFSTVSLVGVAVRPGEVRRVNVQVSPTDDEEIVTETVDTPLVPVGLSPVRDVPLDFVSALPLFRGRMLEAASLFSGAGGPLQDGIATSLPVEASSVGSVVVWTSSASLAHVSAPRIIVVPRGGADGPHGSVRLAFGDRVSKSPTERGAAANRGTDRWLRSVLTLGVTDQVGRTAGFLTAEYVDEAKSVVVSNGGIEPGIDGRAFDASGDQLAFHGSVSLQPARAHSVALSLTGRRRSQPSGASPLSAPSATADSESSALLAHVAHEWQVSRTAVNRIEIAVDTEELRMEGTGDEARQFPSGYRTGGGEAASRRSRAKHLLASERFAILPDARGRHEIRAGIGLRSGMTDRVTMIPTSRTLLFLRDSMTGPVTDITLLSGGGTFESSWDSYGLWLEDEVTAGALRLLAGVRVDTWRGVELDQSMNELWKALATQTTFDEAYLSAFRESSARVALDDAKVSPRIGFALALEEDTWVRGSWGRFRKVPDPIDTFAIPGLHSSGDIGVTYGASEPSGLTTPDGGFWKPGDPLPPGETVGFVPAEVVSPDIRVATTDRYAVGFERGLSGIAALSVDFVSSRVRNLPYLLRANPRLDADGRPRAVRRFPELGDFRIRMFDGRAEIVEATLGARTSLYGKLDAVLAYTWSDTEGNVLPQRGGLVSDSRYQPDRLAGADASVDPLDPACGGCFGSLDGWARHRGSLSLRVDLPGRWVAATIVRYRSGLPYTRLNPELEDTNGDGYRQDLAVGVESVNDSFGPSSTTVDVALARTFALEAADARVALDLFNVTGDDGAEMLNRFGVPAAGAGDPGAATGRSVSLNVSFLFGR